MLERRTLTSRFCMQLCGFCMSKSVLLGATPALFSSLSPFAHRQLIEREGPTPMTSTRVVVSTALIFAAALTAQPLIAQQGGSPQSAPPGAAAPAPPAGERGQGAPGAPGQGRGGGGRGNPAAALYTERCAGCHGA